MSEEDQETTENETGADDAVLSPEDTEWLTGTEEGRETISSIIDELIAE